MTMDSIPHLTELLRTNDPPPELATDAATAIRLKSMEDLRQIEAEIKLLKEKRNHIQKSIDTCNTILSPVRRLPLDIFREIFYHCLPTDRNPIMSAVEAPMLLTRVCGLWRSIAFSSPRIWAKLHIPFPGDPIFSNSFGGLKDKMLAIRRQVFAKVIGLRCQVVKEWLHRSGTCPLSISLHYPIGYTPTLNDANNSREAADLTTDPLFLLVLSFSKRWKQLDLTLPFSIYQKLESHMSRDALPMLQTFRAVAHLQGIMAESASPYHPPQTPLTFMEAPNLQRLYLNSVLLSNKSSVLPSTVWNRFTDLCLVSSISDVDFYNLIQHCHNLITCEVQIEKAWEPWDQEPFHPPTDIVSPIMMFKLHDAGAPMDIFQSIYFPSLEYIHYRCPPRYQEFISDQAPSLIFPRSLLAIIEHTTSTTRTLNIDPRSFKPEDSLRCFRLASEITHLSLGTTTSFYVQAEEDMLPPDSFDFNIFAVKSGCEDILLPKLEVLEMYDVQELTDETLLRVLISRVDAAQRGDVSPLRRVKMQISRQRQEDIREAVLERAKFAGTEMTLELQYESDRLPYKDRLSPSFSLSSFDYDSLPKIWPPVWE